ncbi:GAF domain-containing protein [Pseudomonas palleroniana]|uniref:GAF domain-containing protein n=1 Tax=Pseudomonas palleroniana TaxID=191390 RepID=UPI001FCA625D|nr:GAF domain-containing protein [Pseudomonas palleroniana]UOK36289.1 GAF domain-containing protein [Pseudomonas palleroniana]UOP10110.1 GAF domain-containing protein [Pseudomonas palleroniana]
MDSNEAVLLSELSADKNSALVESDAVNSILQLVTRLTGMRFAGIAKFTEKHWIVCSVFDPTHLGIETGNILEIEITLCSELRRNPKALFISNISSDARYSERSVVKRYGLESYAGAPIFLPNGQLYGALCALDSRPILFEDPDLEGTLVLFADLIGCIFSFNITEKLRQLL